MLHHSSGLSTDETDLVSIGLLLSSGSKGTTEEISVLLLWEVHIIKSMGMWVLSWIISVILPGRVASKVLWMTVVPALDVEIAHRSSEVVVGDSHGSLVGLVVNSLSSEHPLSLLSESLKNVIWANLHDGDFLVETGILAAGSGASLILLNLSEATLRDEVWLKGHVL